MSDNGKTVYVELTNIMRRCDDAGEQDIADSIRDALDKIWKKHLTHDERQALLTDDHRL